METLGFTVKKFNQLTLAELYRVLQLRSQVFVVEQNCVYQDIDGKDKQALHLLGKKNNVLVAYTRLFAPGICYDGASFGRVVVSMEERANKYGHDLVKASLQAIETHFGKTTVEISAQKYLLGFYSGHGFTAVGPEYLEDGIPHVHMVKFFND